MWTIISVLAFAYVSLVSSDPGCVDVAPAANFYNELYSGHWYEMGKIQTAGGAFFQKHCWCDGLDFVTEFENYGDGEVTYACRIDGPDGEDSKATADLFYEGTPGSFKQKFRYPFSRRLDYTVVYIDEDTAVEYDCDAKESGTTSYCVHIMSRVPHIEEDKLQQMIDLAESLGLNNQNVSYASTKQDGCW